MIGYGRRHRYKAIIKARPNPAKTAFSNPSGEPSGQELASHR